VPDPGPIERSKFADRLDRSVRHLVLALIPIALIAVVDLSTGSLIDDRRIDIALLAATAMGLWGAYSLGRIAGRFRAGNVGWRNTRRQWVLQLASVAVLLGLCAGMGYLIGGWVPAVLLPAVTIVLTAGSAAVGIRRRRRIV
jgi:hypothetical protein